MTPLAYLRRTLRLRPVPLLGRLQVSERRLLLRLGDALAVLVGALGSLLVWLLVGGIRPSWAALADQWLWMALIGGSWLAWLTLCDAYSLRHSARLQAIVPRVLLGALPATFVYLLFFFIASRTTVTAVLDEVLRPLEPGSPPLRFAPALAIAGTTGLLLGWRAVYAWALSGPLTRRRILILGAGRAGGAICHLIQKTHYTYYQIVGFIDDDPAKQHRELGRIPVLAGHQQLAAIVQRERIDEVVVAISAELRGTLFQALMDCHERGVHIVPMPLLFEELTGRIAIEHVGSQWYIALPLQPNRARTASLIFKRGFDLLVGALLSLLLLLLFPLIAVAIRLDSRGPVLYAQERLGLHGRRFTVWKFRSMAQDAELAGEARWATANDPRVTRVGRFLRRARLDELPQAWNVLRGEMSVVGPRPERPAFIDRLQHQIPFYRTRLAAKPGLTGWAQINYGYGASVEDALTKLEYDLYYLKHQSLWFDLLILARTIAVVFQMKGQ